jgi:hypothetical protein
LINILQDLIVKKRPIVLHAGLGQATGLSLSRAAFAIMMKFSSKLNLFQECLDELNFSSQEHLDPEITETLS